MLRGCCVSRALTVWCCSRQQVDLDIRQHVPPTLRPSAPFHPAGRGASAAGSGRQHHSAQHALTWHLAPGSLNTPPTLWPHTWLPEHPANTLTSHLAPCTPRLAPGSPDTPPTPWPRTWLPDSPPTPWPCTWLPDSPPTPWPRTWLPAHPTNTLTSHLAPRTPWPCTWLPAHPANTLSSHLAPCTPRQHPDLSPGSPNTPPTPRHSTRPDLLPDTPPTPWPGTWLPGHPSYQPWDVYVSVWPLPLLFAVLRAMFMVVGLVRQAASCLFMILRHTAGYLFREVLVTPSLIICSVRACDTVICSVVAWWLMVDYLFRKRPVAHSWLFVQRTPSDTVDYLFRKHPVTHSWLFVQKTPSDTVIWSENARWHTVIIVDCFYVALFSALEQTRCTFSNIHRSGVLTGLFGSYMATAMWNCMLPSRCTFCANHKCVEGVVFILIGWNVWGFLFVVFVFRMSWDAKDFIFTNYRTVLHIFINF